MKETKLCPFCEEFFFDAHGNSVYCPGKICESKARRLRSKNQYATKSLKADPLWLNEKILRGLFYKHGTAHEFEPDELEAAGLDFTLYAEERNTAGAFIFCMRKFGFSFLQNKKIIIWKL